MDADVGVVGVGTMGSMVMWQLAKRGISVLGFEQFSTGHDRSAAGGESRLFRTSGYSPLKHTNSLFVPILQEAYEQWRELEKETGQHLLTLNGNLLIGDPNDDFIKNILKETNEFKLDHELIQGETAKRRYPQHRLLSNEVMVLDKMAGLIRPELAVVTATRRAEELGAFIHKHTRVNEIQTTPEGIVIKTNSTEYHVGKVIITAGPWSEKFLPELKLNNRHIIKPKRIGMTWYPSVDINLFKTEKFPGFMRISDGVNFFGVPTLEGSMVKVALNSSYGDVEDPDLLNKNLDVKDLETVNQTVQKFLPYLIPEPTRVSIHMDGYTKDSDPIVGETPGFKNVFVMSGFSGGGFKISPAMGKIGADILIDGKTTHYIDHIHPSRLLNDVESERQ